MLTSKNIDQIALALSKAQAIMEGAKKSSTNPFFHSKYADLAEVWDTCRKPLTDNGLCVVQSISSDLNYSFISKVATAKGIEERRYIYLSITSRLLHTSEQYFEDTICMPVEADPQSLGKVTTYIRRYAMMALIGIAPEDDDGESATDHGKGQLPVETREAPLAPETKPVTCKIHNVQMKRYTKGNQGWYSHKVEGTENEWCDGVIAQKPETVIIAPIDSAPELGLVSEPQRRKIFACAREKGIDDAALKGSIKRRFGKDHSKELTKVEASELIDKIEAGFIVNDKGEWVKLPN